MKKSRNWLKVALGAAAGFVVGLLTAPKSGKETRQAIKHKAQQWTAEAEKTLKKLYKQLVKETDSLETKARHLKGRAQKEVEDVVKKGRFIAERVKQMLSDIRDGLADQKEVSKTIAAGETARKDLRAARPKR